MITRKPGRRSLTDIFLAVLLLTAAGFVLKPVAPFAGESFLFPGVAFNDIDFTVGAWCRYTVVDEIMGESDTTLVYLAVTENVCTDGENAYWVEFESNPAGTRPAERQTVKALVSSRISDSSPDDSLHHHVSKLFIKEGAGAAEPADPAELGRLTSSYPSPDSGWVLTHGAIAETPAGRYSCDHKRLVVEDKRRVKMGRATLHKNNTDVYTVWSSADVPVFRIVKYVVERVRDSRTVPSIPGIPEKGREETRTTVELTAFGFDAEPIINILR